MTAMTADEMTGPAIARIQYRPEDDGPIAAIMPIHRRDATPDTIRDMGYIAIWEGGAHDDGEEEHRHATIGRAMADIARQIKAMEDEADAR